MSLTNGCKCSRCNEWHDVIFYDLNGKSCCLECKHGKKKSGGKIIKK